MHLYICFFLKQKTAYDMRISDGSSDVCSSDLVTVPPGSGALKLEDPRLPMLMAAPGRTDDAPDHLRPFIYAEPAPGRLFLWESWLRHEVMVHAGKGERISISRSAESRGGKESGRTCRSRWSRYHEKKKKQKKN